MLSFLCWNLTKEDPCGHGELNSNIGVESTIFVVYIPAAGARCPLSRLVWHFCACIVERTTERNKLKGKETPIQHSVKINPKNSKTFHYNSPLELRNFENLLLDSIMDFWWGSQEHKPLSHALFSPINRFFTEIYFIFNAL